MNAKGQAMIAYLANTGNGNVFDAGALKIARLP
jgi:hypothetical protein